MLNELFSGALTQIFAGVILFVLLFSMLLDKEGKRKRFIEYAPTLMTSIGILGTFIGVVIGLLSFDTENIDKSIPELLEGLKTAFVTSVFGMLSAIIFNTYDSLRYADRRDEEEAEQKSIRDAILKQTELLKEIQIGISGDRSLSVASQIKILSSELSKSLEKLDTTFVSKFDDFSEQVVNASTESIVESLNSIVKDFNSNLFSQFGENFKSLDASVGKLILWQENYMNQIEYMNLQFENNLQSISKINSISSDVVTSCQAIPNILKSLQPIIQTNHNQILELERHLDAFILMRDQAITAVPKVAEQLEVIGSLMITSADSLQAMFEESGSKLLENVEYASKNIENGIKTISSSMSNFNAVSNQLEVALKNSTESIEKIAGNISSGNEKILGSVHSGIKLFQDQWLSNVEKINVSMNGVASKVESDLLLLNQRIIDSFEKSYGVLHENTNNSFSSFDNSMRERINLFENAVDSKVSNELEVMSSKLNELSSGFVVDYANILSKYQEAVEKLPKPVENPEEVI